uniref:mannan endo-1,4-beta-mannosidase n=1 Tax=Kalanchoe fedtschenkoi TaxID=63787 RepID=A0A7N0TF65_KALFE
MLTSKCLVALSTCLFLVALDEGVTRAVAREYPDAVGRGGGSFARTSGAHFVKDGRPFHVNGFNSYWMMYMASDPSTQSKVTSAFQEAAQHGMNVARTWAFSDGVYRALQVSPGTYNADMFKGLDFVISEAKKHGIYLILSLVNNWDDYGGKKKYVQWAQERGGQNLNKPDDFFTNPTVKGYYKNHIKTVLTRVNTITGVAYKDDPTIFAWELMNEPRCDSDPSGNSVQSWAKEMASFVKSLDKNHMLEIGLEGFYGKSAPERVQQVNPWNGLYGTDFISNNQIPEIDFTTIHIYPDQWTSGGEEQQVAYVDKYVKAHIEDSATVIKKPILLAEFGKSSKSSGYTVAARDHNNAVESDTCAREL